jgi:hypothetical protein
MKKLFFSIFFLQLILGFTLNYNGQLFQLPSEELKVLMKAADLLQHNPAFAYNAQYTDIWDGDTITQANADVYQFRDPLDTLCRCRKLVVNHTDKKEFAYYDMGIQINHSDSTVLIENPGDLMASHLFGENDQWFPQRAFGLSQTLITAIRTRIATISKFEDFDANTWLIEVTYVDDTPSKKNTAHSRREYLINKKDYSLVKAVKKSKYQDDTPAVKERTLSLELNPIEFNKEKTLQKITSPFIPQNYKVSIHKWDLKGPILPPSGHSARYRKI